MASVIVDLTGISESANFILWSDDQSLGSTFDANDMEQVLTTLHLYYASPIGLVSVAIVGTNNRFTPAFEASGRIIFEASDGEMLEVTIGDADMSEPYQWTPSNSVEVAAFANHVRGLTDQTATLTLTDDDPAVAPSFADDTGDAQTWETGTAIAAITVPAATGTPTPTYAVAGNLPAGIAFATGTRAISGTPTAIGSGTITIRATNSAGTDDWTVAYTTTAAAVAATVVVDLTGISVFTNYIRWSDNQSLGSTFDANGAEQVLTTLDLNNDGPAGQVFISIVGSNNRFTPAFEATGRIIFEASDGEMLEVTIGDADMSEAYTWIPSNAAEVVAFTLHIKTLVDQTGTLTLTDDDDYVPPPSDLMPTAPDVADQAGVVGTAVDITLAVGTGGDAPLTYSITNLPAGLAATGRQITGTPTTVQTRDSNLHGRR